MLEVEIGDVAEAIANMTERGAVDPVVKATLTLSESGFVSVSDAVVFGEIKDESISGMLPRIFFLSVSISYSIPAGKIKGLFGGSSASGEATVESADNIPPRETESSSSSSSSSSSASSSSSSASASATPGKDKKKSTPVENTIPLSINVQFTTIPPMSVDEKKASRAK